MEASESNPAEALPTGRWEGRDAFAECVRQAFSRAAQEAWGVIILSDPDFADWPLGERAVVDALNGWCRSGRQLRLLAHDFKTLREQAPRWVQWRVTWDHLVQARACVGASANGLPSAIWTPTWTLERLNVVHSHGVATTDARRRTQLRERLDGCWERGSPAFPASTLGL